MQQGRWILACALAAAVSACGGGSPSQDAVSPQAGQAREDASPPLSPEDAGAPPAPAADEGAGAAPAPDAGLQDSDGNPVALVPFDIDSVPRSDAALGALPFFSMPAGYGPVNRPDVRAFARFPFRLGEGLHFVEGASWNSLVGVDDDQAPDKEYSARELRRNLEAVLEQAGAKQVFEGPLRRGLYYGPQLEEEIGSGFIEGVNLDEDTPTTVHVIRQADRNVWVQLATDSHSGALVVVEQRPFEASAAWGDAFPYLALPAGYDQGNRPKARDFDMYPFWTGADFEEVEGRTIAVDVRATEQGYSMHEVRRNLEAMVAQAGGTLVFDGRIPKEASDRYDFDLKSPYSDATGFGWHEYASLVYRVDRPEGQVWIHAALGPMKAGWVVVEREGFVQTAGLLPAAEIKRKLDADGRVALQVHFATDKAEILPGSQPQIAQVLQLLQDDPALRLSIDGHTDATGDAARNQALSEARAQAVVAALNAGGVDGTRLQARGHGQSQPVADNATEDGKARNRRVELVRL